LMQEAKLSPFNVTQQIQLDDFFLFFLELFSTELNLSQDDAKLALDRIYYWTDGQPYLSQKLARAVARESGADNIEELVDRIATRQIAGRAALHSEPHLSHIHRGIVNDKKRCEPLLNLYGKIRKGIEVPADLGSDLQRRLMAIGLLVIDEESNVKVRNKLYELVFTARWANENLPVDFKVPAIVAAALLLCALIPFWYTQWLPNPYVRTLTSAEVSLPEAITAYENFRSFPGHTDTAESLFRVFLERRALVSSDEIEIQQLAAMVAVLPNAGRRAEDFVARFWDRQSTLAVREEDRDTALLAKIQSLALATSGRRQRAASLINDDYPFLLTTLPAMSGRTAVFDPVGMIMTTATGAEISQYSYAPQGVQRRELWSVTALEVSPLVRRVIIDRDGAVSRIGLTLNISHARLSDLRIKIIAPSGRAVEIETGMERASINDDIRIPNNQLQEFVGEFLSGTWSISVRDESLGVAGQLVGWNLKLNSQGAVERFQRGLNIPDPVERETDDIWFDPSGRYAVARAMQSDSARLWDLAFAEPVRAIALHESEVLIGLDAAARRLVTATQDRVNLWDTSTGDRIASLLIGAASSKVILTPDRSRLFVERRGDLESRLEIWDLDDGTIAAEVIVPGVPALVAIDASGSRVAIADFDRAVRVWDFASTELLGQFDLPAQPGAISLSANGLTLGAVYPNVGISLWNVSNPQRPLFQEFGSGQWQFAFSPSGNVVAAGRPETGFQIFNSADGAPVGPPLGVRSAGPAKDLLVFSQDEQVLLTGTPDSNPRIWRVPSASIVTGAIQQPATHTIWSPAADRPLVAALDGTFVVIGDTAGHVHVVPSDATLADLAEISNDVSFVGHSNEVRLLSIAPTSTLAASVAADNTVRLWKTSSGEPLAYIVEVSGAPVSHIAFSPNAEYLGLLSGSRVSVVDVSSGTMVAEYDSSSAFTGLTFSAADQLYLGGEDGSLHLLSHSADSNWSLQQVWQGPARIRLLRASPRGDFLILVDQNNLASQFMLAEGRIGDSTLQLPSEVQEVVFDANASRAYFRSPRWVHRASLSTQGLIWTDALFVPRTLSGAGIVRGDGTPESRVAHRMYLPIARNGYIEIVELGFGRSSSAGLFGNKDELLKEWRERIIASPLEGS